MGDASVVRDHLDFLHLVDSAYPTGSYVHSLGLESLTPFSGVELERLLRLKVQETLARLELVYLRAAFDGDLRELSERLDTLLVARESRDASAQVGRRLLEGALRSRAIPRLEVLLESGSVAHSPVVFGAVASELGVEADVACATYAFQCLRGLVAAAQKLSRLGQIEAQRVLDRLKPDIDAAVVTSSQIETLHAGAFSPVWEIASMGHAFAPRRLFVS
jgi:urease accessory protein